MMFNLIKWCVLKNSTINQMYNQIFLNSKEDIKKLPKEVIWGLKEKFPDVFKDSDDEIKQEIENLYKQASEIINTQDASFYLPQKNLQKLKDIYQKLQFLENYYKTETSSEESIQYYHNIFVLLLKIDLEEALKKFKTFPQEIKEKTEMQYLYASFLSTMEEREKVEEAEKILERLYFTDKCDIAYDSLAKCYFLQEKYKKVIEILTKLKKDKFDNYGFLASIFLISQNYIKQLKEKEILKFNNKKFKDMPIFYATQAQILYKLNPKNSKIKEQFKKGLSLLTEKDVIAIKIFCDLAFAIKLNEEMIKFLQNIELTPYLKIRLVEFLINKPNLNEKEIEKLTNIRKEFDEQDIDVDFIDGIILENQGKEISAIGKYETSYLKKGTINSAYKYIQLSIRNKNKIREDIINKLSSNNDINSIMYAVEGYRYKNDFENAIKNSYKALYLLNNNLSNIEVLRQYCGCFMLREPSEIKTVTYVGGNVGITLKSEKTSEIKKFIIEDNEFYKEHSKIVNVEIIRSTSDLGLELINKKLDDKVEYNNQTYKIIDLKDKYLFTFSICFEKIKDKMNIEIFTSDKNDVTGTIKKLEQKVIEIQNDLDKSLDEYEKGKCLPLSAFCEKEMTVEDYLKVIQNILFLEKDRMFLAGEPRDIDVEKGFVIDLTSIIILALIGKLDVFTPELSEKVYITTSLKNKINYSYELLLKKQGKKEMTIGLYKQEDGSKKLAKNEIEINKEINFFKEIYKCINRFNVEDVEAVKDDILNEKSRNVLDKVQFDLMTLAKQKGVPFICDDLVIRILAEFNYKIEHTNCISLIEYFHRENFDKYIDTISDLVEYNYTYAVYSGKYIGNIFVYLYLNCNDEIKKKVENIVKKLLRNKKSFDMYISDLINIINNSKRVQYTVILDRACKNEKMTYIIDMLVENIKIACDNLGLDYNEYDKYITKESGGIEFIDDNN